MTGCEWKGKEVEAGPQNSGRNFRTAGGAVTWAGSTERSRVVGEVENMCTTACDAETSRWRGSGSQTCARGTREEGRARMGVPGAQQVDSR